MKAILLSVVLLALGPVNAQETDPSGGIFDFSDLDVPPAEVPKDELPEKRPPPEDDPLAGYPLEVRAVLEKLAKFETAKRAGMQKQIVAGRKVAAEILAKRAAAADASLRPAILERAGQLEAMPPEVTLEVAPKKRGAAASGYLFTSWKCPEFGWTNLHSKDGSIFRKGRLRGHWRWLDETQAICVFSYDDGYVEVCQFENATDPQKARIVNMNSGTCTLERVASKTAAPGAEKVDASDPAVQLAASEGKLRAGTEGLIKSKQAKVAAWMLQLAPRLRGEQVRLVVEKATQMEQKSAAGQIDPGEAFGGMWQWQGKTLEFKAGGAAFLGGFKVGRWFWGRDDHKIVVFSKEGEHTAGVARVSSENANLLRISMLKGGKSDAIRK